MGSAATRLDTPIIDSVKEISHTLWESPSTYKNGFRSNRLVRSITAHVVAALPDQRTERSMR